DGRFRIAGLAPGAFQVWATARGMTSAHVPIVARPTKSSPEIHLVLEHKPGARVRGHVVRKGKPASGMTVMAVQLGAPAGAAVSQSDGSFVFDQLPYGATKFCVPPAQPEPSQEVELSRPEVDNVELEVTHIATISGHVTRKGKPVSGASVFYMVAPQATLFGAPPEATTDATGAYTLDVPLGPGQVMAWDIESKSFADPHPLSVASEDDQTVDIELAHAGEVRGTVVDQTGAPVPNAYVRMDLAKGGDQCEAVADANGQFACSALAGGDYFPTVTPFAGARTGFAPATGGHWDPIAVPADGTVGGIQLAIKDARLAIRGTVVDDTGAAIADVRIEAASRGDSSMGYPSALSDTSGRFEIANLAPGSYDLQARAADGGTGEQAGVEAGTTTAALKVMRPGAIEGTLAGFTSTPDVFVLSPTGQQRGGRAIVDGTTFTRVALPPGQYLVNATAGAEADGQTIDLAPGETKHVDLRNRGTGSVEGTVTELGSHAPVPGMRCDAHVAFGGTITMLPPDPSHQAFTDAAGHFVVSAPIGRARVLCFLPTGGPLSAAGGDVDVTTAGRPNLNIASVRATYGDTPGNAGFMLAPGTLPIAVGVVLPNGPTKPASLRPGDQLISIDGTAVDGLMPDGAMTLIMNHKPGTTVTLGIQRGGAPQTVKIVLGSGPLPVLH
ncbi:MAG TPA: carboxypeptidase regulatory-like domain-containing protein, partial [Kofleriaceae bacterium]